MYRLTVSWMVLQILAVAVLADERDNVKTSAGVLTTTITRAQMDRVGVLPVLFEEDKRNIPFEDRNAGTGLQASSQAQLYAEMMQELLTENNNGAYRVVDSGKLFAALKKVAPDTSNLKTSSPELLELAKAIEGLQGLVVGTVRERTSDDEYRYSTRDLIWKLIDLKDGSIVAGNTSSAYYSLADAVYQGRSQEYFRWENGRLYAIGFGPKVPPLKDMPLKPDDAFDLYQLNPKGPFQPHPVFNPRCPFKVGFQVNGKPRGLNVPVRKQVSRVSPFNMGDDSGQLMYDNAAYLPLDPGDSLNIVVKNGSAQNALVGVFVDGINTLGKKRELPDDKCRVWGLSAGQAGSFKGWYSGPMGKEQFEEFVVTPLADSVAGQMGETDQVGSITLVFFNAGWPNRSILAEHPRQYLINGWWDPKQNKLAFAEAVKPAPRNSGLVGDSGFGMGGKRPQARPLDYQKTEPQGTILCSMTIWYGPKGNIAEIAQKRESKRTFDEGANLVLVEGRTNGQE